MAPAGFEQPFEVDAVVEGSWARRGAELRQKDAAFADAYDALDAALARKTATLATSGFEV